MSVIDVSQNSRWEPERFFSQLLQPEKKQPVAPEKPESKTIAKDTATISSAWGKSGFNANIFSRFLFGQGKNPLAFALEPPGLRINEKAKLAGAYGSLYHAPDAQPSPPPAGAKVSMAEAALFAGVAGTAAAPPQGKKESAAKPYTTQEEASAQNALADWNRQEETWRRIMTYQTRLAEEEPLEPEEWQEWGSLQDAWGHYLNTPEGMSQWDKEIKAGQANEQEIINGYAQQEAAARQAYEASYVVSGQRDEKTREAVYQLQQNQALREAIARMQGINQQMEQGLVVNEEDWEEFIAFNEKYGIPSYSPDSFQSQLQALDEQAAQLVKQLSDGAGVTAEEDILDKLIPIEETGVLPIAAQWYLGYQAGTDNRTLFQVFMETKDQLDSEISQAQERLEALGGVNSLEGVTDEDYQVVKTYWESRIKALKGAKREFEISQQAYLDPDFEAKVARGKAETDFFMADEAAKTYDADLEKFLTDGIINFSIEGTAGMDVLRGMVNSEEGATGGDKCKAACYLTQSEKAAYNYVKAEQGLAAAYAYFEEALYPKAGRRMQEARQGNQAEKIRQYDAEGNWLGVAWENIKSIPQNVLGGIGQNAYIIGQMIKGEEADPYDPMFQSSLNALTTRLETEATLDGDFAKALYRAGMSAGDTAFTLLVFGPQAGKLVLSTQGFAPSYMDALSRGGTQGQALIYAGLGALAEYTIESANVDNLYSILGQGKTQVVRKLGSILKQGAGEWTEEAMGPFVDWLADKLAHGDKTKAAAQVKELVLADGYSEEEARLIYLQGLFDEGMANGFEGFLSGLMLATGSTAINELKGFRSKGKTGQGAAQAGDAWAKVEAAGVHSLVDYQACQAKGDYAGAAGVVYDMSQGWTGAQAQSAALAILSNLGQAGSYFNGDGSLKPGYGDYTAFVAQVYGLDGAAQGELYGLLGESLTGMDGKGAANGTGAAGSLAATLMGLTQNPGKAAETLGKILSGELGGELNPQQTYGLLNEAAALARLMEGLELDASPVNQLITQGRLALALELTESSDSVIPGAALAALEKSKGDLGVQMYLDLMNTGDEALAEAAGLLPYLPNNAVSDLVITLNQLYANGQKPDFNDPSVKAAILAACQGDQGDKVVQSTVKSNQAQSSKNMLHAQIAGEDAGYQQAYSGMMAAKEATARAQSALNQSQAHLAQAQAALDTALETGSPAEAVIQSAQAYRAALAAYDQALALARQTQQDFQLARNDFDQAERRIHSEVEREYRLARRAAEKRQNALGKTTQALESLLTASEVSSVAGNESNFSIGKPSGDIINAAYAQKTYNPKFSLEGRQKYTLLAGRPIIGIADLANAIMAGDVDIASIPVDYIVRNGHTLIQNTRTSQALLMAGIPRSQWHIVNRTGDSFYENLLTDQLRRNKLDSKGITEIKQGGKSE